MITYNPEGGDLGRAEIGPVTALELQLLIPHVANILGELVMMELHVAPFKYAFEIYMDEQDKALHVIRASIFKLPPKVYWYEANDVVLFVMRGASGGIATSYVCYLITK